MKQEKCKYCDRFVMIKCHKSMSSHLRVCKSWKKVRNDILKNITKDYLEREHIQLAKSIYEIANGLGLKHVRDIQEKLNEFNIPLLKYNTDEKHKKRRVELAKITSKNRYGYEFHLLKECKEIRKKIKDTVNKRYGVDNVFSADEIKIRIRNKNLRTYGFISPTSSPIIKKKIMQTCINKYGVDNVYKSSAIIKKIQEIKLKNHKYTPYSKQSQQLFMFIYGCLESTNLKDHIYFATLNYEFGKKIDEKYFFYDFIITPIKFCIEYYGSFWHADPRFYKKDEVIYNNKTANNIWESDKQKINAIIQLGFEVWIIWENDFIYATDFYFSQILGRINQLTNNSKRIDLFESNIKNDLKKWRINGTNEMCKII